MIQNDLSRRAVIGRKQNRGFSPTAEGSFRIENMRILADGAAAVREGFAYRCTLPAAPRAMLGADEKRFYVIAGSGFYLTDTETGESTLISEVNTSAAARRYSVTAAGCMSSTATTCGFTATAGLRRRRGMFRFTADGGIRLPAAV